MGDRTYVRLTLLRAHAELPEVQELIDEEGGYDENWSDGLQVCLGFQECNYGNLGFEDDLERMGIAYDKSWDAGGSYTAGGKEVRFTEAGEKIVREYADDDQQVDLSKLMKLIDDHAALKAYILECNEKVEMLPLDENQIEYGKRHKVMQVIDA